MTTAMQELIDWMKSHISDRAAPNDYVQGQEIAYENAVDEAERLLEKEKQQIVDAWENGLSNCGEFDVPKLLTGQDYYTQYTNKQKQS